MYYAFKKLIGTKKPKKTSKMNGMKLVNIRPHKNYGSAIFIRPTIQVASAHFTEENDIKILTIKMDKCTVTSLYKPPSAQFTFKKPCNFNAQKINFVIGDFNSHHTSWGYGDTDENGHEVEIWAETNKLVLVLVLVHDQKLPNSFNSRRWKRGYNPDIIFVSEILESPCTKEVRNPIPHTHNIAL